MLSPDSTRPDPPPIPTITPNIKTKKATPTIQQEYKWEQVVSRDSIEPVYDPVFLPANEIGYEDEELVIGVEINGDARAYAIGALSVREMVNDTVGDTPILVTW